MRTATILAILVLALASVASAAQSLTINGEALEAITLKTGQVCTVGVVSDNSDPYEANIGFDDRVVLGIFYRPRVMFKAGGQASIIEVDKPTFYGYLVNAEGYFPPPSPGVHFTIEYEPNQVGETDIKLYSEGFDSLIDSVHITIVSGDMGTAFTYQGRLMEDGNPADGLHDFQFRLYNDANTFIGNQLGNTIDINDLDVIDGYFTVELDFNSPSAFNGYARWLQIDVRPGDLSDPCEYTILSPRQEVTPTPYALYAKNASTDNDWMISGNDMYSAVSGNVGIGTSTPESRLHIEQSVGAWDEGIRLSYGDHAWDIITDFGGERLTIAPDQDSTEGLVMRNGNVGIGTASPEAKLDVRGNIKVDHTIQAYDSHGLFLANDEGLLSLYIADSGHVGVGELFPSFPFHVKKNYNTGWISGIHNEGTGSDAHGLIVKADGGDPLLVQSASTDILCAKQSGNVGIGTTTPESRLHIEQSVGAWDEGIRLSYGDHAWDIITDFGGERLTIAPDQDSTEGLVMRNGNVGIGTTSPSKKLTVRGNILLENASTGAAVVELGEGLDYSEGFDVTEQAGVTPGTVLVIDAENPGKLTVSSSPYDCKVAGIVAGGEGLGSGVRLGVSQFDQDVALAGRVYCKVDATEAGVEPGDLLTTSGTPGYAMKATDYMRAQGAILGKTMEKLEQGKKGHILVLVTLQ